MSVNTKRGRLLRNTGFYVAAFAAAIFVATPILFALLGGFKDNQQLRENSLGLPNPWNWENYTDVLIDAAFWRQLGNSVFIAVASTFIVVVAAAAVA
jgi:raffinose/stachyose/melibiose transport system permease protein